jgi:hypothetical protein
MKYIKLFQMDCLEILLRFSKHYEFDQFYIYIYITDTASTENTRKF